ncbi:chromosome segregation protein SMC [Moorena producens PAL-8-15-08-1]|uniref:Chromosome partition protein Smc n=1 Tax=Moorena producens PAL-8-15-08-1 TaxID=1458985 RepID=A0A1D8TYC1_9CYAN|nr:chromosome segregation protein SMC [Moorena producens PAL-8-15-08-1]
MVHIKRVELSRFKSFGGTTKIPLLEGFTVISGPNGSGKSNILDALLFCLGIASSKGMRAERLPDLVNHNKEHRGTVEASVTVTFDLSDFNNYDELQVTELDEPLQPSKLDEPLQVNKLQVVRVRAASALPKAWPKGQGSENNLQPNNLQPNNLQPDNLQPDNLQPNNLQPNNLQPNNLQPNNLQPNNLQPNNLGQKATLREQPSNPDQPSTPDQPATDLEWSVTRRLRVTKQGNYSSQYYINGEPSTVTVLHEQLNRLRVYPEGYNVVQQGDVTSIISMKSRERREIIDELAGVAAFDRKITQTKQTLATVKEREERCRIIEQELTAQRDRLAADRAKAEKYQKLRAELQQKQQWEIVLKWRLLQKQVSQVQQQIDAANTKKAQLIAQITSIEEQINQTTTELDQLNARVKALGEEEQIAIASTLATQQAEQRQLQTRQQELTDNLQNAAVNLQGTQETIQQVEQTLEQLIAEKNDLETLSKTSLQVARDEAQAALNQSREQANAIAAASDAWVQQQTTLTKEIDTLLKTINPQRTEQAQLQERQNQLNRQIQDQTQQLQTLEPEIATKQTQAVALETQLTTYSQQVQSLAQSLGNTEQQLQLQQQTQTRLLGEQRQKQRQLDKLEAQAQAQQEAQGTYATKVILESSIIGVCGLVAQLGRVEPRYQLALEIAAGARLGNLVVEDDSVAAAGIELLKQKRAGRATFLPLTKIQPRPFTETVVLRYAKGFVDYAIRLIDCDPRYQKVFAYVFGSTVVFETLNDARTYLGKHRIVTLDGEILEISGAMTGGSTSHRSGLHFGTSDTMESSEIRSLRTRLGEIEQILNHCEGLITTESASVKQITQELTETRAKHSETKLRLEQLKREIEQSQTNLGQMRTLLAKNNQELSAATQRLETIAIELPQQESKLADLRQQLAQLEESQTHNEWQQIQNIIKTQEAQLRECEQALRNTEKQLQQKENQQQRLRDQLTEGHRKIADYQTQIESWQQQQSAINTQLETLTKQITETTVALRQLEEKLGQEKQKRDRTEQHLQKLRQQHQETSWQQQKLQETQSARVEKLASLQTQLQDQAAELPDPIPEIPPIVKKNSPSSDKKSSEGIALDSLAAQLEQLQKELRNGQKRLQAMEPVNMLALEEYDRTQARLQELSEKLETIAGERTELLLRIENFTTLRYRAFKEAFDAVNENFQAIFAELSDGDGYLQLDDPEDPFSGGLNLVAHPKGKPVRRLASMSGGEKSLTALSFIFALQRYRPSPFYAFDEVDMFLDGANVQRLAKMIKQQAKLAQFIVVSLRRPMIESAQRTIGVTQARGAYTQVLGLKLSPKSTVN